MSVKKRFSISADLASGLRNTIQSASVNQGKLHYDMMAVDAIERDPENPRKLTISQTELFDELNSLDPDYEIKQREFDSLKDLAESIKRVGVRNAIEVYKEGQKYRIISGERRYLASIMSGQKSIPTRINAKPDEFNLRYMQWVENINRQDLILRDKYTNLLAMVDAYQKSNNQEINESILQSLLGISSSHAYRYYCLLKAEDRIINLVKTGKLNNLKIVQELVSMKDKGAKEQIISWINLSKGEVTSLSKYKAVSGKKAIGPKKINLGNVSNTKTAKYLIDVVLSDEKFNKHRSSFNNIDWTSAKSVSKAFQALFKTIEAELSSEEA